MNNVQDLQREVDELKSKLETAQKKLADCKRDPWKEVAPQNRDKFYYLDLLGEVDWAPWNGRDSHQKMLKVGNAYKTKEDAEFEAERLNIKAGLKLFSRKFIPNEENWFVYFDHRNGCIAYSSTGVCQYVLILFKSEEQARKAVEFVGEERIKKYYFGVDIDDSKNQ